MTVFRVDNPHTKPIPFWEWLIAEVQAAHPETVFLAEAFTRPAMMALLAKAGFSQSYTYFTWRNTKDELTSYMYDLTRSELPQYLRPNFFANTPDILHAYLVAGGRPAFEARLVLAATLSPSYGIYSGFERCENVPLSESSEEYLNSEKYEIKKRSLGGPLIPLVGRLNAVRRANPALQHLDNLTFLETANEHLIAYLKRTGDNAVITCVNLDPVGRARGGRRDRGRARTARRPSTSRTCSPTASSPGARAATTCASSRACSRRTCCASTCDRRAGAGGARARAALVRLQVAHARRRPHRRRGRALGRLRAGALRGRVRRRRHELYQLPYRIADDGENVIGLADPRSRTRCWRPCAARRAWPTEAGRVRVRARRRPARRGRPSSRCGAIGGEQSNSSVVFGERCILKAYRRLESRREPRARDAALPGRARLRAGAAAARLVRLRRSPRLVATLGILQEFAPGARDGWQDALDSLADPPSSSRGCAGWAR